MNVLQANNRVKKLFDKGQLEEAEALLDEIGRELATRPRPVVDRADLDPANDEYFYLTHRLHVGWVREAYAETLPYAQRCYELERELSRAGAKAYSIGAWGLISFLTRCRRYQDAEAIFAEVLEGTEQFAARHGHDQRALEKVLIAGLCIYFENVDDAERYGRGRKLIRKAEEAGVVTSGDTFHLFARFWARAGKRDHAVASIERALVYGFDPEKALADPDFASLRGYERFESAVTNKVMLWHLQSDPPNARVWLDGVETSFRTPAKMRPPPVGPHTIKLVLDGYAEYTYDFEQSSPKAGLQLGAHLTSLAVIAERERAAEDAARPPDDAARQRTRAFLGDHRRATVVVQRNTTYGLGGITITVQGDGKVKLEKEGWGDERRQSHALTLEEAATATLFDAFVAEAFSEMIVAKKPGYPDEIWVSITLKGAGGKKELGKFGSNPHQRFDRLVGVVRAIVAAQVDPERRKALTL